MTYQSPKCAQCGLKTENKICRTPEGKWINGCPTKYMSTVVEKALTEYDSPANLDFARQASIQEAECYGNRDHKPYIKHPIKPRLLEIIEFAKRMSYHHLGVAYCGGLQKEASVFCSILENNGFKVSSVVCKVGGTPKERIGIKEHEKIYTGEYENMCNPIAQAEILNNVKTDFNIIIGLCVGHDSLFFKYSNALTTVFAVKDRVLGHNPLSVIYTIESYSERFKTTIG